jgi:hypothetical protein
MRRKTKMQPDLDAGADTQEPQAFTPPLGTGDTQDYDRAIRIWTRELRWRGAMLDLSDRAPTHSHHDRHDRDSHRAQTLKWTAATEKAGEKIRALTLT